MSEERKPPVMNRDQVRAWRDRWKLLNEIQHREVQATSPLTKARQLEALMGLARTVGSGRYEQRRLAEESEVRDRRRRLREAYQNGR